MRHCWASSTLGFLAILFFAVPAAGQAWFFPDFALPSSTGDPSTWLAGTYGRGLNEASGEGDAVGFSIGRIEGRVAFQGGIGYLTEDDGEYTAGAGIAFDLNTGDGPRFAVQAGVGWFDAELFGTTFTALRFPLGLAIKTRIESESSVVTPWLMPRANITSLSGGGESETETDFGASGGVSMTSTSGLGVHCAIDALFGDGDTLWQLGLGVHYVLGRRN